MAARRFLIIGATGGQGGAVLDALLSRSSPSSLPIEILALTRKPDSSKAKSLASKPNVTIIQGDTTDASAIFAKTGPVDGVFLVSTAIPWRASAEEEQALPPIDASIAHGVKHIVFTSIDRGGAASDQTPTSVGHFAAKYRIEKYLKEKTAKSGITWTILRPTAFMDNLSPDFNGKAFASMWAGIGNKPLQLVSLKDIGHFGAVALLEAEKYKGQAIGLAGDELTLNEACNVFRETMGYEMPRTFRFVGAMIKFMLKEVREMMGWLETSGYKVDIPALRKSYPELQDFSTFLKENSGFKKK
jgi:uncharacterized protein YbjT (DUF2867 family)